MRTLLIQTLSAVLLALPFGLAAQINPLATDPSLAVGPPPAAASIVNERGDTEVYAYVGFYPVAGGRVPAEYTPWPGAPVPEGGTMQIFTEGQEEPYLTWPSWGTSFYAVMPYKTPFLVRLSHDSGFAAAAYIQASASTSSPIRVTPGVPVPDLASMAMERPKRTFLAEDSPRGFAGVILIPALTDDASGRGVVVGTTSVFRSSDPERTAWMRVEYLPGCNLHGRPDDVYSQAKRWQDRQSVAFYWDQTPHDSLKSWNVPGPVPDGPVRLHFSLDGYTTSTLETRMIPGTHVWWYPIQAPLVPSESTPLPSVRLAETGLYQLDPPPQWIVDRAQEWKDSGVVTEFVNLTPYLSERRTGGER